LEGLCDHAEYVLNGNRYTLDDIEELENHVGGQYYNYKYDPRREAVLQRGTPEQKTALEQEEARMDEVLSALHEAYLERFERKQLRAKSDPAELAILDDRRQDHVANVRKRAESLKRFEERRADAGA